MKVTVETSPSLALVKYWGKLEQGVNIPATSSLAVTLDGLRTTTTVADGATADRVLVNGTEQPIDRYTPILTEFRRRTGMSDAVEINSHNNFPTAAGIASSSSGLAALALGLDALFGTNLSPVDLSSLARFGSGSGCRAVYGGFTTWRAGAEHAERIFGADHWPELRILVVVVHSDAKGVSSRDGMIRTQATSPYYDNWVDLSPALFETACSALADRDLSILGQAMRHSYLSMFASMFAASPPLLYWRPESVSLIHLCQRLREEGVAVWETMDAGPQVKMFTTSRFVGQLRQAIEDLLPGVAIIEARTGGEPSIGSPEV